jgi:hypothetical protein
VKVSELNDMIWQIERFNAVFRINALFNSGISQLDELTLCGRDTLKSIGATGFSLDGTEVYA